MKFVNLTPHAITFRSPAGDRFFQVSGAVARAAQHDEPDDDADGMPCVRRTFGAIEGLPEPEEGTVYIVSAIVASAAIAQGRIDVIAPDSGPSAIRRDGKIEAVVGWVRPA